MNELKQQYLCYVHKGIKYIGSKKRLNCGINAITPEKENDNTRMKKYVTNFHRFSITPSQFGYACGFRSFLFASWWVMTWASLDTCRKRFGILCRIRRGDRILSRSPGQDVGDVRRDA